jgi:MscS family membrane protein
MNNIKDPHEFIDYFLRILEGGYGLMVQVISILAFVIIFNFFIKKILFRLREHFIQQQKVWKLSVVSAIHKPLFFFVWFLATLSSLDIIHTKWFPIPLFDYRLFVGIGSVLTLCWFLLRLKSKIMYSAMQMSQQHKIGWTLGKLDLVGKLGSGAVLLITGILLMDVTGRNMQTLITFGGIGGVALAFASQQVISNFFGGLMIYLTQPFSIGEWVSIPDKKIEGRVELIGFYSTRICNLDKKPIYIPNSVFAQSIISNASRNSHEQFKEIIRLRFEDIQIVNALTKEIYKLLDSLSFVDSLQDNKVHLLQIGTTSLDIEVLAYVSKLENMSFEQARQEILIQIMNLVAKQGAQIAPTTSYLEISNQASGQLLKESLNRA